MVRVLEAPRLAVLVQDGTIFVYNIMVGVKCRSTVNVPAEVPYTNNYDRVPARG